jgi:single-stranded DNA-binding protein
MDGRRDIVLPVNCWRQLAENVTETLGKGARAIVIGRLHLRSWETDEGERRSVVEVEADEVAPSLKFATATNQRTSAKAATVPARAASSTTNHHSDLWSCRRLRVRLGR